MRGDVLVTSGGRWVGAVTGLSTAAASLGLGAIRVASSEAVTPAGVAATASHLVPPSRDPGYGEAILSLCRAHHVRVVVPLTDRDIDGLMPAVDRFAEAGIALACPGPAAVALCADKQRFADWCEAGGIACLPRLDAGALLPADYPVFARPRRGHGSVGAQRIDDLAMLVRHRAAHGEDLVLQPFHEAQEFTVDAVLAVDGAVPVRVVRQRQKVIAGESWRSIVVEAPAIAEQADRLLAGLAAEFGYVGPATLQFFGPAPVLAIEANARIGSASVLGNAATEGRYYQSVLRAALRLAEPEPPSRPVIGMALYRYAGDMILHAEQVLAGPSGGQST